MSSIRAPSFHHSSGPSTPFRTDIFPSRPRPKPYTDNSFNSSRSSSTLFDDQSSTTSSISVLVPVPFSDGDPFAPATVSIHRARGARISTTTSLPQEVYELLQSSPPSAKKRRPTRAPTRPPSFEAPDGGNAKATPGLLQKGLFSLKGITRRPSNLTMADTADCALESRLGSPLKSQLTRSSPNPSPTSCHRRKLSISSDLDDTPRSWREYSAAYANVHFVSRLRVSSEADPNRDTG